MKVFLVRTERDGKTKKGGGEVSTEILTCDYRYAAETIEEVWEEFKPPRGDEEIIVALVEEHSGIFIIPRKDEEPK